MTKQKPTATREEILKMPRSAVRYQLYRVRTSEEGGCSHTAAKIQRYYEKQPGFTEWREFARKWDLGEEGQHADIKPLKMSEEQKWNQKLLEVTAVLPFRKE